MKVFLWSYKIYSISISFNWSLVKLLVSNIQSSKVTSWNLIDFKSTPVKSHSINSVLEIKLFLNLAFLKSHSVNWLSLIAASSKATSKKLLSSNLQFTKLTLSKLLDLKSLSSTSQFMKLTNEKPLSRILALWKYFLKNLFFAY